MDTKKPWQSKTVWVALIMSVVAFIPAANQWIQANPTLFSELVAGLVLVLRLVSKGAINIVDDSSAK